MLHRILLLCVVLLLPPTIHAEERVKVGVILPLSGEAASYGEQFRRGLDLAPSTERFEFIFEDSRFQPTTALTAFKKLVERDRIAFLVSFGGATCEVLNREAQRLQIVHLAAGCNTAAFSDPDSFSFRLDVNEEIAALQAARYLRSLSVKKVALLYLNDSWGGTIIDHTRRALTKEGISVVVDAPFDAATAGGVQSSIVRIQRAKPDLIFLVSLPNLTPLILKQLKQQRVDLPIMSTISVENPEMLRLAGRNAEGIFYLSVKPDPRSRQQHPTFFKAFPDGNPFAAWGYDTVALVQRAATHSTPRHALHELRDFVGAFNAYTFNRSGELGLPYEIREIQEGRYVWRADVAEGRGR